MGDNWRTEAACTGVDPAIFYPERGSSTAPAKAICAQCPVTEQCLAFANLYPAPEISGVWGGKSEQERRLMRRSGRRRTWQDAAHGTRQRARICDANDGDTCDPCRQALNRYKSSHRFAS